LQRAESLHHAPTILGRLGECQVAMGQIVQGTENLNSVVREPLAANAPQVFRDAQTRAQKVLTSATPKIAYLTLRLDPADAKANVLVDGKAVPPALIGAERPTDPGTRQIEATAEGYLPVKSQVTLLEGAHQELAVKFEKDPNFVAAAAPAVAPAPITPAPAVPPGTDASAPPQQKSHTAAFVAYGVGGAGILVGSIAGIIAISKSGDCPSKLCKSQGDLDSLKSTATVSTIGFGVGVAGIALGTILLVVSNKQEAPPATASAHLDRKFSVQPWFGLNSAGVMGTFQ